MRPCSRCKQPKREDEFYKSPFYVNHVCIKCKLENGRKIRATARANREAIRLAQIVKYLKEVKHE